MIAQSPEVVAIRAHLRERANLWRRSIQGDVSPDEQREAREWAAMSGVHRTLAHMMAGIDGDLDALADRPWRAIPDPERDALRDATRGLMLAYRGFVAVRGLPRGCA